MIHDEPRATYWDTAGSARRRVRLPHVRARLRPGEPAWDHRSATPIIGLFGSPRLDHVVVQAELETFAIESDGTVAWRVAHTDVVTAAEFIGGRLVLTVRWPGERHRPRHGPGHRLTPGSRPSGLWTAGG